MSIKTAEDWRGLREIGRIVAATLRALQAAVTEGITTGELDRIAADLVKAHGARSAPGLVYAFPGTVLISVNDEVGHRPARLGACGLCVRTGTGTRGPPCC